MQNAKVGHIMYLKPIFHLATLFARRKAKTRIWQCDWLKLAGEKICREQVGSVTTFLSVPANKVAKWKIGLSDTSAYFYSVTESLLALLRGRLHEPGLLVQHFSQVAS